MNSNWGLVDPLPRRVRDKREKRRMLAERAQQDFEAWLADHATEAAVAG
jgi:folate-dependent tRNA-U54 methylase TrmFO/GidA